MKKMTVLPKEAMVYKIQRKVLHCQKRADELKEHHGDNPSKDFNYYGGYDLGYWKGRLSALEDILDEIEIMYETLV